jgi:hypothetical protein
MKAFQNLAVKQVFDAYPPTPRARLMAMRDLIFQTAAANKAVGEVDEALKWGEPAYLTSKSKSGSTIRMDWKKAKPEQYALYFNCQTTLIDTFRSLFSTELQFMGNRAIVFSLSDPVPKNTLAFCIEAALTYHIKI